MGWILFATMWVAGPITGYAAFSLISFAWERRAAERRKVVTIGLFGGLLEATTLLMLVDEL